MFKLEVHRVKLNLKFQCLRYSPGLTGMTRNFKFRVRILTHRADAAGGPLAP